MATEVSLTQWVESANDEIIIRIDMSDPECPFLINCPTEFISEDELDDLINRLRYAKQIQATRRFK